MSDGVGLIKDLATGSIMTGMVSEVHINNMKMYPFIFLDNVDSAEISYNIVVDPSASPGTKSSIAYSLRFIENVVPETLSGGAENLKKALSALFTQNIRLILKDHNEQLLWEEKDVDRN